MSNSNGDKVVAIRRTVGLEIMYEGKPCRYYFRKSVTPIVVNFIENSIDRLVIKKISSGLSDDGHQWFYVQFLIDDVVIDKGYLYEYY